MKKLDRHTNTFYFRKNSTGMKKLYRHICDILFQMLTLRLRAVFHPGPETDSSKFVQINIRSLATKSSPNFQI